MEEREMEELVCKVTGGNRHRYTSLRDVLQRHRRHHPIFRSSLGLARYASMFTSTTSSTSRYQHYSRGGGSGSGRRPVLIDASAIRIRDQLVKRAASAYLKSAATVVDAGDHRDRVVRMWRRCLSWRACLWDPLESCVGVAARTVSHVLAAVVGHLDRLCERGRSLLH
ncbi:uncharacterized protein LOC122049700 [Zingiber officinale]|uniref:uncharacterized protein LOC122049700 n=1 Tax=Zingiber officinale TaxID=94328 RepID=UPI001C4D3D1E|nr:uncharacterized protein LOC122049700 [Zingiber officinale]